MRLTIEIPCPSWLRNVARVALPALVITTSGMALAVPNTFSAGDTLTASALNDNFAEVETTHDEDVADLDARITTLEEAEANYLASTSSALQGSTATYTPLVYQNVSVDLTPGTWLVQAAASAYTSVNPDSFQVALWNDEAGAEVAGSRSGIETSFAIGAGCGGANASCSLAGAATSAVITVTEDTTIKIRAIQNGNSRIWMGPPIALPTLSPANRITAVRLR